MDNKAPKDYYVPLNMVLVDKETWNKGETELKSGKEWDSDKFLRNDSR